MLLSVVLCEDVVHFTPSNSLLHVGSILHLAFLHCLRHNTVALRTKQHATKKESLRNSPYPVRSVHSVNQGISKHKRMLTL
jgi:hypothetical protein